MAAAIVLAVRGAGAGRGAGRDHIPVAVHDLDEPERMESRLADHLCRARKLSAAAERSPVHRSGRAYARLHRAIGAAAAHLRHFRGRRVPHEIPVARLPACGLHHADDGNAGRDRAGLDHDVPSATRRTQLSAFAGRLAAAALGVPSGDRDPLAGAGRDLAMDSAGHADRARRHRRTSDRTLRKRADRRRRHMADVPLHHAAADHAVHIHRRR